MKKAKSKTQFSFKEVNKRLVGLLLIMGGIFFASQIVVMSQVGTKSQEIELIRQELDEVRKENEILTAEIDKEKSIGQITPYIDELGLESKSVVTIEEEEVVGLN